ncbi:hypothetical protein AURDEDRAFT_121487 [Auricularia subglabra TFB-10046 SS5]|nr:hypothetical protein AURDEDRAFT_121487 [Auricularia subglabra TFB-10046 SS5]
MVADEPAATELIYLQDSLLELRARHAIAVTASLEARDALERAQEVAADRSSEERYLHARCDELDRDICARRAALQRATGERRIGRVQRMLARFPPEMLQAIFVEAVDYSGDIWSTCAGYDTWVQPAYLYQHAGVPFALAAVNRQWRALALCTPALWTLIAVPELDDSEYAADFVAYVNLILERSRNLALDLMLCWADCHWNKSEHYGSILDAIGFHVHRWRSLSVILPVDTPVEMLGVLRHPSPLLEALRLEGSGEESHSLMFPWKRNSPIYFPFSPRLRRLHNTAFFNAPRLPSTELLYLALAMDGTIPISAVCALIFLAPSLKELQLNFVDHPLDDGTNTPPGPSALSHLEVLGIYGDFDPIIQPLTALDMPRLREFRMINFERFGIYSPLLDRIGDTVTTLAFCDMGLLDALSADDMHFIRKLKQLRHLVFRDCSHIDGELPGLLASRSAAGLPHPESISFESPRVDEESAGHVSTLMLTLHALRATGKEGAVQFSLTADPDDVPAWLLEQYEFITAGSNDVTHTQGRLTVSGES